MHCVSLPLDVCRKLEQEHKEKLAAVRSELMKEIDQLQQQAGLQREELEAEVQKIRDDESFLRDHLSISVKVPTRSLTNLDTFSFFPLITSRLLKFYIFQENRRLEMELLDSTDKLVEAQSQITKLQTCVDSILKERVHRCSLAFPH